MIHDARNNTIKFCMFIHLNFNTISYLGELGFNKSYLASDIQGILLAMKMWVGE